jgi:transaldolase
MAGLHKLNELGQSVWLDFISREIIENGELKKYIERGISGLTSNPTIFEKAIARSGIYDSEINRLAREGDSAFEVYEKLAVKDICDAADILLPVYNTSKGIDGYVSLEANPHLAYDTEGTIEEVRRLHGLIHRPNVLFKVPGTVEGISAIEELVASGVNVNVTLIFSVLYYEYIADAYIKGLERFEASGGDISKVASVASFFVSRIDSAVDKNLKELGIDSLLGKTAVANAKLAYSKSKRIFRGERWEKLAAKGAGVQRLLWASTSTKNPDYSDTIYVDKLIGAHTVNTMPPETIDAFEDHGIAELTIEKELEKDLSRLDKLDAFGIDLNAVTNKLLSDGVAKFTASFDSLIKSIESKID